MNFLKVVISFWNSISSYKIGTLKKKLQFKKFDGTKRYFLVVDIEGEECDIEVNHFQINLFSTNSLMIVKCQTYQNSNYIQTILW